MPANLGERIQQGPSRAPRYDKDSKRIALSIRLDRDLHNKIVRSAELNGRSIAAETEFQLRKIYQ